MLRLAVSAEVEVLKVHAAKPITHLGARIIQQDGETVLEGEA